MLVRAIEPSEHEAARCLLLAAGWDRAVSNLQEFQALLAASQVALVAVRDGPVLGFVLAITDGLTNGYISMVVVAPEHRGQGVGSALVRAAMGESRRMTWVLRASDDGAITFYKKLGFTQSAVALERAGDKTAFASAQVDTLAVEFGITRELVDHRGLLEYLEATDLVAVGVNSEGREHRLTPAAAQAWFGMQTAAATDGVELLIVSAFRSVARQAEIVRRKLGAGQTLSSVLALCAPPGFSEHHTGRAIDVTTPGSVPLEQSFDQTAAFAWLSRHAGTFGFRMSYPVDNTQGFAYEPWHWCFK